MTASVLLAPTWVPMLPVYVVPLTASVDVLPLEKPMSVAHFPAVMVPSVRLEALAST